MAAFFAFPCLFPNLSSLCSDFGFKLSDDLSLEVCVPDPEFAGKPYDPPVPCPVGSTYRKTRGYVRAWEGSLIFPVLEFILLVIKKTPNNPKTHKSGSKR